MTRVYFDFDGFEFCEKIPFQYQPQKGDFVDPYGICTDDEINEIKEFNPDWDMDSWVIRKVTFAKDIEGFYWHVSLEVKEIDWDKARSLINARTLDK